MKPDNSVFIVQGEIFVLLGALRSTKKWISNHIQEYEHNPFVIALKNLRDRLIKAPETLDQDISLVLGPFLDVVKAENISGPVTELALTSIGKFIKLRLIDPSRPKCAEAVRSIVFSLSHAKFSGTDSSYDEVVLMKILEVLRDIFLSPCGLLLSNDNICEIVQSCFKLCFEEKVTDLLRRGAESILENLVQFLFERLPTYPQESKRNFHDVKLRSYAVEASSEGSKLPVKEEENEKIIEHVCMDAPEVSDKREEAYEDHELSIPTAQSTLIVDQASVALSDGNNSDRLNAGMIFLDSQESTDSQTEAAANVTVVSTGVSNLGFTSSTEIETTEEFVNPKGIRFTHDTDGFPENEEIVPYGIPFVVEILRYLVTLVDPHDTNNSDRKVIIGLRLITVAVEAGVDFFATNPPLMSIVTDTLCKNLISLLIKDRNSIFIGSMRICFLLFEALRSQLKLQLQKYLLTLRDIVMTSNPKITAERRELALEGLVQLWKLPGIVTEMYLNYDCDVNCSNLFEDTIDVLQKIALPDLEISYVNALAFTAMMFVIDEIEARCRRRVSSTPEAFSENIAELSQTTPGPSSQPFRFLRVRVSPDLPTHEQLLAAKRKKLILISGAEKFNEKPTKGIQFLQEKGLLSSTLDSTEVAMFLRDNSRLDKKMIGEYLSNRKNMEILDAFVKSFDFSNKRIDVALREYLESFRLPGEAPLIDNLIQLFADHWHKSTGEPFASSSAAFTLAYAVIMLNTDQHNTIAKKHNEPMKETSFIQNLRGVNGGENFDQEMLIAIYNAIKNEEIVMPAEQSGIVRDNYLWKVLLGRSATSEGNYLHASNGMLDQELFQILAKGPVVKTLCMLWKPLTDPKALNGILNGFKKCVMIGFHYNMTDIVDTCLNALSKFVPLISDYDHQYVTCIFGRDIKGQMALRTYFSLIRRYCNGIRDAWKNLCTGLLGLYNANLLPNKLLEIEDIIEGTVSIGIKSREPRRSDTGFIYSLFNMISSSDQLSPEELDAARDCVQDCGIEELLSESKFMRAEALIELIKAIIEKSPLPEGTEVNEYSKSVTVFFVGLLSKIIIHNRERASLILPVAKDYLQSLILDASANNHYYILDRSVNVLLRLAIYLISKEELASAVSHSLGILLQLKATSLERVSKPVIWGLYELLKTGSSFVKEGGDWMVLFTLLECAGAGASLPKIIKPPGSFQDQNEERKNHETNQESDKGYTSDSELYSLEQKRPPLHHGTSTPDLSTSPKCQGGGWMVVGKEGEIESLHVPLHHVNQYSLNVARELFHCEPSTYMKSIDVLEWIIRESGCINYINFRYLVQCCRVFVEASIVRIATKKKGELKKPRLGRSRSSGYEPDESEDEDFLKSYQLVPLRIIDSLYCLYEQICKIGKVDDEIWGKGLCPVLQGFARLCCDTSKDVRTKAITHLQRALLMIEDLKATQWESCFNCVLFPLLEQLLDNKGRKYVGIDETRMRASALLSKVFLQHLQLLVVLPTFTALWLMILESMEKYSKTESDLLADAIPESMKNMLLVMETAGVFNRIGDQFSNVTWDKIETFLPGLKEELTRSKQPSARTFQQAVKSNSLEAHVSDLRESSVKESNQSSVLSGPSCIALESTAFSPLETNQQIIPEVLRSQSPFSLSDYFQGASPIRILPVQRELFITDSSMFTRNTSVSSCVEQPVSPCADELNQGKLSIIPIASDLSEAIDHLVPEIVPSVMVVPRDEVELLSPELEAVSNGNDLESL